MNTSEILTSEDKEIRDMAVARLTGGMWIWKSTLDSSTCVEHVHRNGKVFHIKEIEKAHIKPPRHKDCRCILVPYIDEDFV